MGKEFIRIHSYLRSCSELIETGWGRVVDFSISSGCPTSMHTYVSSINWTSVYLIKGKRVQILEGDVLRGSRGSWKRKWGVWSHYICIHVQNSQRIISKRKLSLKKYTQELQREFSQQSACLISTRTGIQSPEPLWKTLGVKAHACISRALEADTGRFMASQPIT